MGRSKDEATSMKIGDEFLCSFEGRRRVVCKGLFYMSGQYMLGEPIYFFLAWPSNNPRESDFSFKELMVGVSRMSGVWSASQRWE